MFKYKLHVEQRQKKYKNNKINAPTWSKEFGFFDYSYSISDFHNYVQFIIKKHETMKKKKQITINFKIRQKKNTFKINSDG